jgi:hypothetical protein
MIDTSPYSRIKKIAPILIFFIILFLSSAPLIIIKILNPENKTFFSLFGKITKYTSNICFVIVWMPQIYLILKDSSVGDLNIWFFIVQIIYFIIDLIKNILYLHFQQLSLCLLFPII